MVGVTAYDEWATPRSLFAAVDEICGFTVDAAAVEWNRCIERFWSPAEDGLSRSWAGERVWVNPPFSDCLSWVRKAELREADLCVMLLPVWSRQLFFRIAVEEADAFVSLGRVRFLADDGRPRRPSDSANALFVFAGSGADPDWGEFADLIACGSRMGL